ncbi:MAG: hypothetical protein C0424_04145 [Sphingobacteriaceae bacterium]|nr:hypothetical protein [Sphingobacteriaceae bacterium]
MTHNPVWGQTEGLRYRETRRAVLELLENYDRQISREGDNVYVFKNLFTDSNAIIANDILMENFLDELLPLNEYEIRRDKYYSYRIIQKDMVIERLGSLNYTSANAGNIDVVVSRQIQWSMKRQDDFVYMDTLTQVFRVNFEQGESGVTCKIASISNTTPLGKHLLLRAAYQQNKKTIWLFNDTILMNGRAFTTDHNGYLQIKRLQDNQVISVKTLNPEFHQTKKVSPSSSNPSQGFSEVKFRLPKWALEVQSGFMPLGYSNVRSSNFTSTNQLEYLIGLCLGRSIKKTAKWEWMAKLSVGQSWHKTLLSTPEVNYSYAANDPDNFGYERKITITDFSEQLNMAITTIGIGLSASYRLNAINALQAEFGYQHVASQTVTSSRTANGLFGGFYPELFGVSIFENGIYDFGSFELAETNVAMNSNLGGMYSFQLRMSTKLSRTSSIQYGLLYRQSTIGVENSAQQPRLSSAPNQLNSLLQTSERGSLRLINFTLGYQYKF